MRIRTLERLAEGERRRLGELRARLREAVRHLEALERAIAESDGDLRRALAVAAAEPVLGAVMAGLAEAARRRRARLVQERATALRAVEDLAARLREARIARERWLRLAGRLRRRAAARQEARRRAALEELLALRAVAGPGRRTDSGPSPP